MDFDLTAAQRKEVARAQRTGELIAAEPSRARKILAREGCYGLRVPRALGGPGADLLTCALILEALADAGAPLGELFSLGAHLFGGLETLQRAKKLDRKTASAVLSGAHLVAHAVTEREAGSDVSAMSCRAEKTAAGYRLTGRKSFVSNAADASSFVVYAKTAPRDGLFGLSAFWIKAGRGARVGKDIRKSGLSRTRAAELTLDTEVSASSRLGEEGDGWALFQACMQVERAALPAFYLGQMSRAIRRNLEFTGRRTQFSRPLLDNQAISHVIAEHQLLLEQSRLMLYRACRLLDRGRPAERESALSKWLVTDGAMRVAQDSIQIHGALGIMDEAKLTAELHDALPGRIFSGTNELLKEIVLASLKRA